MNGLYFFHVSDNSATKHKQASTENHLWEARQKVGKLSKSLLVWWIAWWWQWQVRQYTLPHFFRQKHSRKVKEARRGIWLALCWEWWGSESLGKYFSDTGKRPSRHLLITRFSESPAWSPELQQWRTIVSPRSAHSLSQKYLMCSQRFKTTLGT